jgi:hypothetical protein
VAVRSGYWLGVGQAPGAPLGRPEAPPRGNPPPPPGAPLGRTPPAPGAPLGRTPPCPQNPPPGPPLGAAEGALAAGAAAGGALEAGAALEHAASPTTSASAAIVVTLIPVIRRMRVSFADIGSFTSPRFVVVCRSRRNFVPNIVSVLSHDGLQARARVWWWTFECLSISYESNPDEYESG